MNLENNVGIHEASADFALGQNQPNPFNNNTVITYSLNEANKLYMNIDYSNEMKILLTLLITMVIDFDSMNMYYNFHKFILRT